MEGSVAPPPPCDSFDAAGGFMVDQKKKRTRAGCSLGAHAIIPFRRTPWHWMMLGNVSYDHNQSILVIAFACRLLLGFTTGLFFPLLVGFLSIK